MVLLTGSRYTWCSAHHQHRPGENSREFWSISLFLGGDESAWNCAADNII